MCWPEVAGQEVPAAGYRLEIGSSGGRSAGEMESLELYSSGCDSWAMNAALSVDYYYSEGGIKLRERGFCACSVQWFARINQARWDPLERRESFLRESRQSRDGCLMLRQAMNGARTRATVLLLRLTGGIWR